MAKSLREVMNEKSDEGLMDYLTNFSRYTPEAIAAAVDELKSRGRIFGDEELNVINEKIQSRTQAERGEETLFPSDSWKTSVVTDPNAPLFYSKGAIRAFSVLFSPIFGAVLLSFNVNETKRKWIVIGFGIIYTATTIILLNFIPSNTIWVLLLNTAGGLGLTTTFWDRYVGKEMKYRTKPIWKPLVISIIITIPFLFALIYTKRNDGSQLKTNEYCYLGLERFKKQEYGEAIKLYSKAFELDSSNTEAIYMRGLSKANLGDSKGAIFDYSVLVKLSPNDAEVFSLMAEQKLNVADSIGAWEDCEKVVQIGSTDPNVYLRVGTIQMQLRKLEAASTSFSQAIVLHPTFGSAFYNRGIARYYMNEFEDACDDLKQAMRLGIPEAKAQVEEICK